MNGEASFSSMAPPTLGGESYRIWAVRMQAYMEALDLREDVEDKYIISPLLNNPKMAQIKVTRKGKLGNQRQRNVYLVQIYRLSSLASCL